MSNKKMFDLRGLIDYRERIRLRYSDCFIHIVEL